MYFVSSPGYLMNKINLISQQELRVNNVFQIVIGTMKSHTIIRYVKNNSLVTRVIHIT